MTQEVEEEILTFTAIGKVQKTSDGLKRQEAKDYLLELYHTKRHSNTAFDFQAALDKEIKKISERCKEN